MGPLKGIFLVTEYDCNFLPRGCIFMLFCDGLFKGIAIHS